MAQPDSHHLKYRPHVDGLRAVAILPVICFHADLGFTGGYVGVDVFFVISGYLISALILKELSAGQFHITDFWERRIRRIFPALAVVVLACLAAAWFFFFPQEYKKLGQSAVAQALLVSNFYFYQDASYFAQGVDVKPLLHTWSLAVEEQFYLLFPFVLMAFRRVSRRSFEVAIILMGLASLALSVYCSYKHPRANFYFLPPRAWELLIGSLLAAMRPRTVSIRWLESALSCLGLLGILYAVFFYNSETRFPGAAAILPCVGAALMIWANDLNLTITGKLLASAPMVFIGKISYSLYLWHWPLLVFAKYTTLGPLPMAERVLILLASIVLATLSWKYVETPFRKRALLTTRPQIFGFGAASTAAVVVVGLIVFKMQGFPSRIPPEAMQYLSASNDAGGAPAAGGSDLTLDDARRGDFFPLGQAASNAPIRLLVWGDSHAKVLTPMLDALCREHACDGAVASHSQTAPLVGYDSEGVWSLKSDSMAFNNAVVDFVRGHHVPDVLIVARWDYYIDIEHGTEKLRNDLIDTTFALQKAGARVWILRQVPRYDWNVPKGLASAVLHGRRPEELGLSSAAYRAEAARQDPIFDGLAARFPGVKILDPSAFFMDASGRCQVAKDGKSLYLDSDHVSDTGAMMLRPLFESIFTVVNKNAATARDRGGPN